MRTRGFCSLSAPTDVAFILRLEHHVKLQVPLKIAYSGEQIWWFHARERLLQPFSSNGSCLHFVPRAPHEAVSSFENYLWSPTNIDISCVWEACATFQLQWMLPSFCPKEPHEVVSSVENAAQQILRFHPYERLLQPSSSNGYCLHLAPKAPHEAVSSFKNHICSPTNIVILSVWKVSAAFQLQRMLPLFWG